MAAAVWPALTYRRVVRNGAKERTATTRTTTDTTTMKIKNRKLNYIYIIDVMELYNMNIQLFFMTYAKHYIRKNV